jgi:hypothetical protein
MTRAVPAHKGRPTCRLSFVYLCCYRPLVELFAEAIP